MDDFDFEDRPKRRHHRPRRGGWRDGGPLVMLAAVAMLAVVAVVYMRSEKGGGGFELKGVPPEEHLKKAEPAAKFTLGVVSLGETPEQVRVRVPDMVLERRPDGEERAAFRDFDGAMYHVSFLKAKQGQGAYRIQYRRTYSTIVGDEVIEAAAEKYGRPATGSCQDSRLQAARDCSFSWWLPSSNRLYVNTRTKLGGEFGLQTSVSMVATNVLYEGRATTTETPPTPEAPSSAPLRPEKLPF